MATTAKSIGQLLRKTRLKLELTLQDVKEETGISVATLSRIERSAFDDSSTSIRSDTLSSIKAWIDRCEVGKEKRQQSTTPDIVSLHLRADKNLDAETADALAQMFKTAYEGFARAQKK